MLHGGVQHRSGIAGDSEGLKVTCGQRKYNPDAGQDPLYPPTSLVILQPNPVGVFETSKR